MKKLMHIVLLVLLGVSVVVTVRSAGQVAHNPAIAPLIDRSAAEILAITDRMMAREATPERLASLIERRLTEDPRNWVALKALAEVALERGQSLPPAYVAAWAEDSGFAATTGDCLRCVWDISTCSLSLALICKAPILLTPVEDLRGVIKAGTDYSLGQPIDQLDFGLSVLGLGATGVIMMTGGTSVTVKAGTATIRLARGMGRLSPTLTRNLTVAMTDAIRWTDLPKLRGLDDLPTVLRSDALRPIASTLTDLGRIADAAGPVPALHLLPLIDDATDARRLANVAESLGPRTVGRAEVLGKSRLLRATVRFSDVAISLIVGLIGTLMSIALMVAATMQTLVVRWMRNRLRAVAVT
ncbi:MAG: hypothetical protein ACK4RZ_04745 [Paracoccaceae bacterium]